MAYWFILMVQFNKKYPVRPALRTFPSQWLFLDEATVLPDDLGQIAKSRVGRQSSDHGLI
jgi:hypothetical protein